MNKFVKINNNENYNNEALFLTFIKDSKKSIVIENNKLIIRDIQLSRNILLFDKIANFLYNNQLDNRYILSFSSDFDENSKVEIYSNIFLLNSKIDIFKNDSTIIEIFISDDPKIISKAVIKAKDIHFCRSLHQLPYNKLNENNIEDYIANYLEHTQVEISKIEISEQFEVLSAVASGSKYDPVCLKLSLHNNNSRKVKIVAKGIMFDTGGYNIKTIADYSSMKRDMGGAIAALGYIKQAKNLNFDLDVYLVFTSNMISNSAYLPGDVLTFNDGQTVEVINTDGEGRLIMTEINILAQKTRTDLLINIATLTGNVGMALGNEYCGLITNINLGNTLQDINQFAVEKAWQLPLSKDLKPSLESDIADLKNAASINYAGCITAGLFLEHYIKCPWLFLDIAAMPHKLRYNTESNPYGIELLKKLLEEMEI